MVGTSPRNQKSKLQSLRGKSGRNSRSIATSRTGHKLPLLNKVFYLDLKNAQAAQSLQSSLESLGAKVEVFLIEEVNYVVTDRVEWLTRPGTSTLYPSPFTPQSPASSVNSPAAAEIANRSKTRAECMLERVRCRPQQFTLDPLDNALRWGINIYAYDNIAESVARLLARRRRQPIPRRSPLQAPYIKFENFQRDVLPTYGEFVQWPTIDLNSLPGSCPFPAPDNQSPTRRDIGPAKQSDNTVKQSHNTVKQSDNTAKQSINTIKESVSTVKQSAKTVLESVSSVKRSVSTVKQSAKTVLESVSSVKRSVITVKQSAKTVLESVSSVKQSVITVKRVGIPDDTGVKPPARIVKPPVKSAPLDIQEGAKKPRLFHDTPAANCRVKRMTRKAGQAGTCDLCSEHYDNLAVHVTSSAHRRAASCADTFSGLDLLIAQGPSMNTFIKQHVANGGRCVRACNQHQPMTPNLLNGVTGGGRKRPGGKAGARTRSMSGGQLYLPSGLLGTTAEDGGNPLRQVLSGSSSGGGGGVGVTVGGAKRRPCLPDSPPDPRPPHEMNGAKRRRQQLMPRRSQLAVLSDEAQNFMFREPTQHSCSSEDEDECHLDGMCHAHCGDDGRACERVSVKVEPGCVDVHGERRRKRRSQAEAFITDNRDYYKFETPGSRLRFHDDKDVDAKPVLVNSEGGVSEAPAGLNGLVRSRRATASLTFMFQTVPVSEPWYETFQRQDNGDEYYYSFPSAEPPFLLPYQLPPPRFPYVPLYRVSCGGRGRGRRRRGGLERKPRKSPRCHASTLAILSGFIQRRKKDPNKVKEAVLREEPPAPPLINPPIRCESDADVEKLAATLDQAMSVSGDDLDLPEWSPEAGLACCESDVTLCELLSETCANCVQRAPPSTTEPPHHNHADNWRTRKKKKRKNLTGWPSAKRAKLVGGSVRGARDTDDTASCVTSEGLDSLPERCETEAERVLRKRTLRSGGVQRRASPRKGRN